MHFLYLLCPAAADPRPAQRMDKTDDNQEPDCDSPMDFYEERDYADQGPLIDMDMEEDAEILFDDPYCALPRRSESGGIVQPQDRFRLDEGRPGVVCLPSHTY
jgi:hypothetical protein